MSYVDAPPKASILIESMRDIGYSLEMALADVIDNSITAGARNIHILVDVLSPDVSIGILDDGSGMTRSELIDAMRLGSRHPRENRDTSDLGRFGLGLKTASFSQCRKLTVAARKGGKTSIATWDLDHVRDTDQWSLIVPQNLDGVPFSEQLSSDGVLVVWEKLDRAVEQDGSDTARKHFTRRIDEVRQHLELVFHRFLKREGRSEKVVILLNGRELEPFDPFNASHPATHHGNVETIPIRTSAVRIKMHTLPHHSKVTRKEWDQYGGPQGYLRSQGFYLYRERRLIVHGTWFGLARQTELTKLTRVQIDIPNELDAEWQIDVKKAWARPPLQVRTRLQGLIEEIGAPSRRVYRERGRRLHDARIPIWERVLRDGDIIYSLNVEHPVLAGLRSKLPGELVQEFADATDIISAGLPMDAIFADLAGSPEAVKAQLLSDSTLYKLLAATRRALIDAGIQPEVIASMLRTVEPFRSQWDHVEGLLERLESEDAS